MRWPRLKSLSGLMLLGLALIAVPLLWAVGDAAFQIRSLSATSQQLVLEGVQSARLSRSLIADIASLERTARLYNVIITDPRLLDTYRRTDQSLATTRSQLALLLDEEPTRRSLEEFAAMHNQIAQAVGSTPPGGPAFAHHSRLRSRIRKATFRRSPSFLALARRRITPIT